MFSYLRILQQFGRISLHLLLQDQETVERTYAA